MTRLKPLLAALVSAALSAPAQASSRAGRTSGSANPANAAAKIGVNSNASGANVSAQAPALIQGVLSPLDPAVLPEEASGEEANAQAAPAARLAPLSADRKDLHLPKPAGGSSRVKIAGQTAGPPRNAKTASNDSAPGEELRLASEKAGATDAAEKDGGSPDSASGVLAKLASFGALFDGGSASRNPGDAAVPSDSKGTRYHMGFSRGMRLNAADLERGVQRVGEWRLNDDAFEKQPSVENLIGSMNLKAQHAVWLENQIFTDRLTGLRNAIYLREKRDELVAANDNLVTMKLDWLKEINDGVSHAAGDRFLELFGQIGKSIVGDEATLIRRSPTGFAALIPGDREKARLIAQALRLGIEQELGNGKKPVVRSLDDHAPVATTISAGLARLAKENADAGDVAAGEIEFAGRTGGEIYKRAYARAEEARMSAKDDNGGNTVAFVDGETVRFDENPTIEELKDSFSERDIKAWPSLGIDISAENAESPSDEIGETIPGRTMREKVMYIAPSPELRETINALMRKVYNNHLSGLHNRRWLDDNLNEVFGFFTEIHAIDIDKFGDVNKLVGEEEADRSLGVLGKILHEQAQGKPALALHLSGEEFFILTRMGPDRAAQFAHRVREHVAETLGRRSNLRDKETGEAVHPTISIGISPIPHSKELAGEQVRDQILEESEEALKRSKNMGRNWVSVFGSESTLLDRSVSVVHGMKERTAGVPGVSRAFAALGRALRRLAKR
jgi:diguanylate cyclase (GGDEF)-like protein